MPQDIPLEASETLAFTPPSLAQIDGAPSFTLRAATTREKRFRRRLMSEEGVIYHSEADVRDELLRALRTRLWGEEKFATHSGALTAYWEALDDFRLQRKEAPELEWSYDEDAERAILSLIRDVEQSWPQIGRMKADNIDFNEIYLGATVAVVVTDWTGIDVRQATNRSYLTIDCVDMVGSALQRFAIKHGIEGNLPFLELANACARRMALDEDEEKNSESPSPSEMTPPASSMKKASGKGGKSQASARSSKTRVDA
ncbi:hypothetical protein [Novosphingobium sp.]|uniref:hypothetical protein n=1 Tax=Novosphingobium sp. TaxID=1874826 RepID=UPI002FDCA0CC